jgi:hypothetical protein
MVHVETSANVFGRIAALGAAYRIDVTRLLDAVATLAPELEQVALVATPHSFDRIAVMTHVPRDGVERAILLCDDDQRARIAALAATAMRGMVVELETVPGAPDRLAVAVQVLGQHALATELARLQGFGVAVDTARAIATTLGGGSQLVGITDRVDGRGARSWTLQIAQSNRDAAARAATRERVERAAPARGGTRAPPHKVAGLHDSLAHDRDSFTLVHSGGDATTLAVVWGVVPWEHVVRMMLELYRGEAPKQLGELAGAAAGDVAAMIEIGLGASEPPAMRVAAAIGKGRA